MNASTATGTIATADPSGPGYRGRFAPSPTGDLHLGSLVAALASRLEALRAGGRWLLRIEDLDVPRQQPGAAARMLATLERLGFEWDEPVVYQNQRLELYAAALTELQRAGLLYRCCCSRRERAAEAGCVAGCRQHPPPAGEPAAIRLRLDASAHLPAFDDRFQGHQAPPAEQTDPVLVRRDGLHAYLLAVVVDDGAQRITDVVRGADLLHQTPVQIVLQRLLALPRPTHAHVPVLSEAGGAKLAKSRRSLALDGLRPADSLVQALRWLRQDPAAALARAAPREIWQWAEAHWNPQRFHGLQTIVID